MEEVMYKPVPEDINTMSFDSAGIYTNRQDTLNASLPVKSVIVSVYRIENGKITTPLRDVILSGNVFETLKNITLIGNDLKIFGGLGGCGKGGQSPLPVSDGSPHIFVNNVLVG